MGTGSASFKDLIVWKKAIELVTDVYKMTQGFPSKETFGLTSQMRRAAISIPSNIAEGSSRRTARDFAQFLHVALGSATELETQLIIARNLDYLERGIYDQATSKLSEICKMLHGLLKKIRPTDN